jgi:hypothetical protein
MADLMDDDDGFSREADARVKSRKESPVLSSLVASASLYHQVVQRDNAAKSSGNVFDGEQLTNEVRGAPTRPDGARNSVDADYDDDDDAEEDGDHELPDTRRVKDDAGAEEGEDRIAIDPLLSQEHPAMDDDTEQQQRVYYKMAVQKFTDVVCAYLRSTENVTLVSAREEHIFFPVLLDRLQEFHVTQLLDILECHWCRSTMLRYGTRFKDVVRDRIAQLATVAATQLEEKKHRKSTTISSFSEHAEYGSGARGAASHGDDSPPGGGTHDGVDNDDAIFTQEELQPSATASTSSEDAILAHADEEITAATIYRALIVTGMGAGHRKRDLAFFQLLGNYLSYFINDYHDPHDLVRVLTALARAKIVPSPAFLNLLARRLPVLHKRTPLEPVPAYRAISNFARMGHTSMNTFRFLADCMLNHMEKNIREERRQRRQQLRNAKDNAASAAAATDTQRVDKGKEEANVVSTEEGALRPDVAAKQRLRRICGLKPSRFSRLLLLLARFNAPHQQYLRPLITPVIIPMIPYFPPPSFTRLIKATHQFRSNDVALIEAYVTHACDVLAPSGRLTLSDVQELLFLLSLEDTPIPANLDGFLRVCRDLLRSATATEGKSGNCEATAAGGDVEKARDSAERTAPSPATGTVTFVLRPNHMCRVINCLGAFQRKVDIPLETLSPLVDLADDFARRLAFLMELGLIALPQVDEFVEKCARHQIPDPSGSIERLSELRRDLGARLRSHKDGAEAASVDAEASLEDDYYGQLDVDVRETFMKILITNEFNTYGSFRPLPGPLQVDFREELTKVSAFELLQSVDLFNKACPGALHTAPRMYLSRSLLEKVGKEGEVVVEEETNRLVVRQPRAELLTRDDLKAFVELVQRTPLEAVRNAPVMWTFIKEKAERLGEASTLEAAMKRLRELRA